MIIAGVILLVILAALLYFVPALHKYHNTETLESVKAGILVLSNLYGQLVMVILLSYGLFRVPVFLWRRADKKGILMDRLRHADIYYRKYRDATLELHKQVSICRNLAEKYQDVGNRQFFKQLLAELPDSLGPEEDKIVTNKDMYMVVKKGQVVGEDFIAQIRMQFKQSYFQYKRRRARWISCYESALNSAQRPIDISDGHYAERIITGSEINRFNESNMKIKPLPNRMLVTFWFRFCALICLVFCVIVIITQSTLLLGPEWRPLLVI